MFKIIRENDDLQKTLALSMVLHAIFFITLIRSSFNKYTETLPGSNTQPLVNSMMVELNPVKKDIVYKKQKINIEKTANHFERYIKKELLEKKLIEQKHQEHLNKEKLHIQKASEIKRRKTGKTEKDIVKIAEKPKRVANLQREGPKVDTSDIFSHLNPDKNALKGVNGEEEEVFSSIRENQDNKKMFSDYTNIDGINIYARRIREAVERFFYDFSSYTGQICRLKLKIAPDGALLNVKSEWGDHALCTMALSAARQAKLPKPPSQEIYNIFKNTSLDFKP